MPLPPPHYNGSHRTAALLLSAWRHSTRNVELEVAVTMMTMIMMDVDDGDSGDDHMMTIDDVGIDK